MNIFDRLSRPTRDYTEVPPEAPKPKMWKSLGHVMAGVEAHYHLATWGGELDADTEAELKIEMACVAEELHERDALVGDEPIIVCRNETLILRLCECQCGTTLYTTRN